MFKPANSKFQEKTLVMDLDEDGMPEEWKKYAEAMKDEPRLLNEWDTTEFDRTEWTWPDGEKDNQTV